VTIPGKDNLSPRINRIDKNIASNTGGISTIQKNITSIKDTLKKLESNQTLLTSSLNSISQLQNDMSMMAGTLMNFPSAINDQMLVALRQLWTEIGLSLSATLQNIMNVPWPAAPFNRGGMVYASKSINRFPTTRHRYCSGHVNSWRVCG
jgi:hypothetical protein